MTSPEKGSFLSRFCLPSTHNNNKTKEERFLCGHCLSMNCLVHCHRNSRLFLHQHRTTMVRITTPTIATMAFFAHSASAFVSPASPTSTAMRLFSSSSSSNDNYATPDEIQKLLTDDRTVVLDVRRADEIQATGYLQTPQQAWVTIPCTPDDATLLEMTAPNLLRDKTAPVLVHCAAGKRAAKAKQVLEDMGYECVVNAGGFAAVQPFVQSLSK